MKKFNSILAIAAVALTSVFGFTSCDKNDDSINNAATPVRPSQEQKAQDKATNMYYGYQVFVSDQALALGDLVVTVDNNGQTQQYKASEGQTGSMLGNVDNGEAPVFMGRVVVVPVFKASAEGVSISVKFEKNETAIAALPTDGCEDYLIAYTYSKNVNPFTLDVLKESFKKGSIKGDKYVNIGLRNKSAVPYLVARSKSLSTSFQMED